MEAKEKGMNLFVSILEIIPDYVIQENNIAAGLAKQCALICVKNEYRSKRELLFDLRSSRVIESEVVYLKRLDDTFNEEKEVKQEIEKL